ncbi:sugar phosphate isomerase/epimerase family protein [Paraburkholderia bannensis]|uniref:sugar phosphate isomerase/epimerase family protein n=1 Tax=Paraburkholderia bannensis TaxID=765414 RepID=UPI002AC31FC3|nr:TIM barrel protein [Paraburkholderia bannensis]
MVKPHDGAARALAVAHLTALECAPVEWVRLAAKAGFDGVGLRLHPATPGGVAYPVAAGSAAQRELRDVLAGEGVALLDVEFVPVVPDLDPHSLMPLFETAAALGAASVSVSGDDPDEARLAANLAALAMLATPFGLRIDLEFMRWRHVGTLAQARAAIGRAAQLNLALVIDALHLSRAGSTPGDVAALPPGAIGLAQLCDAPAVLPANDEEAIHEARSARLAPGDGALPLDALLRALPPEVALSVEMPMPSLPEQARMELAYRGARRVVERASYTVATANV